VKPLSVTLASILLLSSLSFMACPVLAGDQKTTADTQEEPKADPTLDQKQVPPAKKAKPSVDPAKLYPAKTESQPEQLPPAKQRPTVNPADAKTSVKEVQPVKQSIDRKQTIPSTKDVLSVDPGNAPLRETPKQSKLLGGPGPNPSPDPGGASPSATFRVTLNGFTVNHETNDDPLEIDGARDEVYLVPIILSANLSNVEDLRQLMFGTFSSVMGAQGALGGGAVNGEENRVRAGTATGDGGLQTGDSFPDHNPTPWRLPNGITTFRRSGTPPALLFEGTLTEGQDVVLILPTIWEWDGPSELRDAYYHLVQSSFPSIARGAVAFINAEAENRTAIDGGWDNALVLPFTDGPKDRPIGIHFQEDSPASISNGRTIPAGFSFSPQALTYTYRTALHDANTDLGRGIGIREIRYRDDSRLAGDYSLYIQVQSLGYNAISHAVTQLSRTSPPASAPPATITFDWPNNNRVHCGPQTVSGTVQPSIASVSLSVLWPGQDHRRWDGTHWITGSLAQPFTCQVHGNRWTTPGNFTLPCRARDLPADHRLGLYVEGGSWAYIDIEVIPTGP
jgi:hypothetical protein